MPGRVAKDAAKGPAGGWCELKATWSVAVIFDKAKARETGMAFCDSLVHKFWADNEFDVSWWNLNELQESSTAEQALKKSAVADVVVFAIEGVGSDHFQEWTNQWLKRRGRRKGALVGLVPCTGQSASGPALIERFLRHLAHRAGMDFLTAVPQIVPRRASESLESCDERAHRVTTVLDGILHRTGSVPRLPG